VATTIAAAAPSTREGSKYEDNQFDMTDLDLLDIGDDEDFEDLGVGQSYHPLFSSLHWTLFLSPSSFR
jgi:hypothetical protein